MDSRRNRSHVLLPLVVTIHSATAELIVFCFVFFFLLSFLYILLLHGGETKCKEKPYTHMMTYIFYANKRLTGNG